MTARAPKRKPPGPHAPRLRAARDLTGGRTPHDAELDWAIDLIDNLGPAFHDGLVVAIGQGRGRRGSIQARHVLVLWALAYFEPDRQAQYTRVVRDLLALTEKQRTRIGLGELPPARAYQRFWDKTSAVIAALAVGFEVGNGGIHPRIDLDWFVDALARSAIPAHLPASGTRAVDGTDWETCGAFVTPAREYDGATPEDTDADPEAHARRVAKVRTCLKGRVSLGADGRPVYTKDIDGRAGHRSANNAHSAGLYIGYELHLGVQVRDFTYRGKSGEVVLGQDVPNFVTSAVLTPAGADRVGAVVPRLTSETVTSDGERWTPLGGGEPLTAVIWDRGYSIQSYERGNGALRAAGIGVVFDLSTRQRVLRAIHADIDWIDGIPFSRHMPASLRDLPRLAQSDTPTERAEKIAAHDRRAVWRWTPHTAASGGYRRWRCPFCAGRLRAVDAPNGNAGAGAPLVEIDGQCCSGTVTLADDAVKLEQASGLLWGTTAHATVYGQRSLVENANNLLHDKYAHLDRKFTKLMGIKNRKFVLAFLLAGVNRKIAVAWEAKEAARDAWILRMEAHETAKRGDKPAVSAVALRQRRARAAKRERESRIAASGTPRRRSAPRRPART